MPDFSQIDWMMLVIGLQPVLMWALNLVQDNMGGWKMPKPVKWAISFLIAQALAWLAGLGPVGGMAVAGVSIGSYMDGRRKPVG